MDALKAGERLLDRLRADEDGHGVGIALFVEKPDAFREALLGDRERPARESQALVSLGALGGDRPGSRLQPYEPSAGLLQTGPQGDRAQPGGSRLAGERGVLVAERLGALVQLR
jgi:hypothetical protein